MGFYCVVGNPPNHGSELRAGVELRASSLFGFGGKRKELIHIRWARYIDNTIL